MKFCTTRVTKRILFFFWMLLIVSITVTNIEAQSKQALVNIGSAGDFVILAKTGISTTGATHITGDIGVSPVAATYITGFGLIMDASTTFATSSMVTGKVYAANYTSPTEAKMTVAISDMQTAYTNAAGRTLPDYTELYAGDITSRTLTPGLYKWSSAVLISAAGVTISGTSNDVWIFQIAQNLTVANSANIILSGGALASNIFWQVAGNVTLGTSSVMNGIILSQTGINFNTNAILNGRAFAQTNVTLDANAVTKPANITSIQNSSVPQKFELFQNYPNPFNPTTQIRYNIEKATQVTLKVYNVIGYEVATLVNSRQEAGIHTVSFGANTKSLNLSSGVYFYRLEAGANISTKKLIFLK